MANERCSIDEFIKSLTRYSWAMSLFGVKQIANTLLPGASDQPTGKATAALDAVTRATEGQFDDRIKLTFRAGDQLQKGIVDFMYDVFTLEAFTPRTLTKMTLDVMGRSADLFGTLTANPNDRAAWLEFKNKMEAFDLFEHVDSALGFRSKSAASLPELIEKASARGPFFSVWVTEGLGHYYAETVCDQTETPRSLLSDQNSGRLPSTSLAPLHAGMGLSFANRALKRVRAQSSEQEIRAALEEFIALCRDNSSPGYLGAACEPLGFVARNLYPQMIQPIDRQLSVCEGDLLGYFWHGVGRAIYFAPTNFLPSKNSTRRGLELCLQEPPHLVGRLNALAGFVWALTLVNIRQPEILESLLRLHCEQFSESDAFSNGISSAIVIWRDSTRDDSYIVRLSEHQPSDPSLIEAWNELIAGAASDAVQIYPSLKRHDSVGEAFRYQSLSELVARVESAALS